MTSRPNRLQKYDSAAGERGWLRAMGIGKNAVMRAPRDFEELKSQIARRYGDLSGRLQQIAEFALHHPNDMALGTVAVIAERAGVQPSSIVRFANSFGFDGFSEMQQLFRLRLLAGAASYRDRIAALQQVKVDGGGSAMRPVAVLERFVRDGIAALEHLHETIRADDLDRAVRLMAKARELSVLAQGRAFPVAYYIHYALTRLDRRATLLDSVGGMVADRAKLLGRDDALVVASFKDYAPEVVHVVDACAARGVKIVAITDTPLSPVAKPATIHFEIAEDRGQPFRSLVAPMCLAQSLIVAFGHHLENRPN